MVKHIQGCEFTKKVGNKQKVCGRQFAVKPCFYHLKPSYIKHDHITFDVGTKDILSSKNPDVIAQTTVDQPKSVTARDCRVTVSGILRNDPWNRKVKEVNDCLI